MSFRAKQNLHCLPNVPNIGARYQLVDSQHYKSVTTVPSVRVFLCLPSYLSPMGFGSTFSCNDICKLLNGKCHVSEASRFALVSRRSKAGLQSPPFAVTPTRRYAHTPIRRHRPLTVAALPRYVICGLFHFGIWV